MHALSGRFAIHLPESGLRRMTSLDGLGFLAAGLVLATFCMKRLIPLRVTAMGSNLAFMLYGHVAGIEPRSGTREQNSEFGAS